MQKLILSFAFLLMAFKTPSKSYTLVQSDCFHSNPPTEMHLKTVRKVIAPKLTEGCAVLIHNDSPDDIVITTEGQPIPFSSGKPRDILKKGESVVLIRNTYVWNTIHQTVNMVW